MPAARIGIPSRLDMNVWPYVRVAATEVRHFTFTTTVIDTQQRFKTIIIDGPFSLDMSDWLALRRALQWRLETVWNAANIDSARLRNRGYTN